jgi:predicted amidohydrolase YtcJ
VAGDEELYGRLAPGMAADITAFAQDPVDTPADELPDVPVASPSSTARWSTAGM